MTGARPRYARSTCCVPFCARWSTLFKPGNEWCCAKHWRLADRDLRRYHRVRLNQLYLRWEGTPQATPERAAAARRWWAAHDLIWGRIKRQVIGRAGELPV